MSGHTAGALARLEQSTWDSRSMPNRGDIEAVLGPMSDALLAVVNATRAYLPPDGIGAQECLNRILAATDNQSINPIIAEIENGRS